MSQGDLKSKRICVLIPDGVGVKNYLFSDLLSLIKEQGEQVTVWHPFGNRLPIEKELDVQEVELPVLKEPFLVRAWREAISYARLSLNAENTSNPTILSNWMPNKAVLSRKMLYGLAESLGKQWKSEARILKEETRLNKWVKKSAAFQTYRKSLEQMQVDFLLCTHQRVPLALPVMLAARDLGIQTATVIFSWDNVPKARLPFRSDLYFVWSQYMKDELKFYYQDIEEKQIKITSTPQFDHYQNTSLIESREDFANTYGLTPESHWVLFSGDDKVTSPFDPSYLKDVGEALKNEMDIELLFRQVPVESTERYDHVLNSSRIKHIPPLWKQSDSWTGFMPTREDIALLVNLAYHCKVVINIGSTMALDFAFFNHTGLYINYDQPKARNWSVDIIYKFQHFRTMDGLDPVGWINGKDEILPMVRNVLDKTGEVGVDKGKWLKRIAGEQEGLSAQKIAEAICS